MSVNQLPRRTTLILSACALVLTILSLSVAVARYVLQIDVHPTVAHVFGLDEELNVPTAYQSATLLASALLLYSIAMRTRRDGRPNAGYWFELALVFLFLFLDETVRIHERLGQFRDYVPFHAGRVVRSGWVVFGALFVGVVAIINLRFLWRLPRRTAVLFIIAGVVFVSGAAGMEVVAGPWVTAHGRDNLRYALLASLEEVLEMAGIIIFIHALLEYQLHVYARPAASTSAELNRSPRPHASPVSHPSAGPE